MSFSDLLLLIRQPAVRLFYMATGYWVSQALFVAADLGVFTLLESQPLSAKEFCESLKLNLRPGQALLSALVALGLLRLRRRPCRDPSRLSPRAGAREATRAFAWARARPREPPRRLAAPRPPQRAE